MKYVLHYPDGLQMLINRRNDDIVAIAPLCPREKIKAEWERYYDPDRWRPTSWQQLDYRTQKGEVNVWLWVPDFDRVWEAYAAIKNKSEKNGAAGNGSKELAKKEWDKLTDDLRKQAYYHIQGPLTRDLTILQPWRAKKDLCRYLKDRDYVPAN